MDALFESLGLPGLHAGLQWVILIWGLAILTAIPLEILFWMGWRSRVRRVSLDGASTKKPVKPAFYGENEEKRQAQVAAGDAYAGPDLGPAEALEVTKKSRVGLTRQAFFWILLAALGVAGAWLIFGDPFVGTAFSDALNGEFAGRSVKDVLASLWFLIVMTAGRGLLFLVELRIRD